MSTARLPINHWDTGKVSRDKINDSFNDVVNTVAWYRPHIEAWYWYIWTTNTGVKAKWDSVEMKEEEWYVWYKSESNWQWTQIIAIEDLKWDKWDTGDAATITLGTVCTGAAWSDACITNSGTTCAAIFNFTIPQGATGCTWATGASICEAEFCWDDMVFTKDNGCTVTLCWAKNDLKWDTGSAATIDVGCVTTWEPWTSVCVCNSGTCCAAILDFTIPQGAKWDEGAAATITVWTTTTWESGTCACVTNTWTCNAAVLNFTIPKGAKWEDWCDWASICAAAFSGDDMVFTRDDSCTVTIAWAKTALKWDTGNAATVTVGSTTTWEPWGDACVTNTGTSCSAVLDFVIPTGATWPAGNGICSVTSTKAWKVTTVDITCTNGCSYCFQVQDWADGQWGDMCANTYDPTNKSADAFDYCNFYHTPTIPTDNCQLANSCWFITNAVNDLTNYYLKCETYKKCEVDNLISNFGWFEVVSTLPTQNIKTNVIYLKWPIWTGTDRYEEWIYYSNTWTQIWETSVDLTNYAKCCDIPTDNCQLANSCWFTTCTGTLVASDLNGYAQTNSLCTVATSGKYCDLTGTPTLCTVATSWKYCDLTWTPTIPTDNCQLANGCWYTTCTGTVTSSDLASYVTNACVACINWCCLTQWGDICIQWWAESNTKTFCMACNNDLVTAQAAYDWYKAGNNPIICYCQRSYITSWKDWKHLPFTSTNIFCSPYSSYGCTVNFICKLTLCSADGATVCGTYVGSCAAWQWYLATHYDYTTPYNPEYPWSPATKKYVDDHDTVVSASAPETPSEWMLWYDTTNDVLKTYDWSCWNSAGWDSSDIKAFYITWNDKVTAQAAYDWYCSGKTPVIVCNNNVYTKYSESSSIINFVKAWWVSTCCSSWWYNCLYRDSVVFCLSSWTVTCVRSTTTSVASGSYLATSVDYASPYTPCYAGSPTTKKYVDDKVYTWDTAPVTAVEGQIWSDTCNNIVKVYDWSNWNAVWWWAGSWDVTWPASSTDCHIAVFDWATGKIIKDWWPIPEWKSYCEWVWIEIADDSVRDTQWPAPIGFHVPTMNEWQNVRVILTSTFGMANNGVTLGTYLKVPLTWYRRNTTWCVSYSGSCAIYWYSQACAYYWDGYDMVVSPSSISCNSWQANGAWMWNSVRAFKNEPATPDSSWTTLYDGSGVAAWAWIFCNSALWLISISWDWTTWYTIMDKNLWATTVYNQWDAITDANSGCFYQWWNNYWFPHSWAVTTSSTKVDASCYWPWNYYCCSTFITGDVASRSCVVNTNLWWYNSNCCTSWTFINNTWVTSVNGCTWNVCLSVPTDNCQLSNGCWYTTCTWTLTDGSLVTVNGCCLVGSWDICIQWWGASYCAWYGIDIEEMTTRDTQWPAPEGYHIPTKDERSSLLSIIGTTLGRWTYWDAMERYLNIPMAWYRMTSSSISGSGSVGAYWSSSGNGLYWCELVLTTSFTHKWCGEGRTYGYSLRAFKDTPVVPDSSWTTVYDGSGVAAWAWVFCNSTLWLISVSGDWTNWTTIADKNSWASVVYNIGNSVTDANGGCFYQWWNNYWFPHSWAVTTSATLVDASSYWPWNYYCCDVFITNSTSPYDWSCVANANLWWGNSNCCCVLGNSISATVASGDSGTTYTLKVSNTAPWAWTPNTTITFVTGS